MVIADIVSVQNALPPRWLPNARFIANLSLINNGEAASALCERARRGPWRAPRAGRGAGPGRRWQSTRSIGRPGVREGTLSAGMVPREITLSGCVRAADGSPRFVGMEEHVLSRKLRLRVILRSAAECQRWREQYEAAKAVDSLSATADLCPPGTQ